MTSALDGTRYVLGSEFETDARVLGPAQYEQNSAVGDFDGDEYFFIWRDGRRGEWDLFGTHVSADGHVLEPEGIPLLKDVSDFALAYGGSTHLLLWTNGSVSDVPRFARVDRSGRVLDPDGVALSIAAPGAMFLGVAGLGGEFGLIWHEFSTTTIRYRVLFARASREGRLLDSVPTELTDRNDGWARIVASQGGYTVAWLNQGRVHVARVSAQGTVLETKPVSPEGDSARGVEVALAADASQTVLAWQRVEGEQAILAGARLSADGTLLDSTPKTLATSAGAKESVELAVVGGGVALSWRVFEPAASEPVGYIDQLKLRTFDASLGNAGPVRTINERIADHPRLVAGNAGAVLSWHQGGSRGEPWAQRLDRAFANVGQPFVVALGANRQVNPSVAVASGGYLMAWTDDRRELAIYGAAVDSRGEPRSVLQLSSSSYSGRPKVASVGQTGLFVWAEVDAQDGVERLGSAEIDLRTKALGEFRPLLSGSHEQHSLTASDRGYALTWVEDRRNEAAYYALMGLPLDVHGAPTTSAPVLLSAQASNHKAITWDGSAYVAAWMDWPFGVALNWFDASLRPRRATPLRFSLAGGRTPYVDAIAASPNGYAIAMRWNLDASVLLLDRQGNRLNFVPLTAVPSTRWVDATALVWDGTHYVLLWQEHDGERRTVRTARFDEQGRAAAPESELLSDSIWVWDSWEGERFPLASASAGKGATLLAYEKLDETAAHGTFRLKTRVLREQMPLGRACDEAAVCESGHCVDGVCCNSACAGGTEDCTACSVARGGTEDGQCGAIIVGGDAGCTDAGSAEGGSEGGANDEGTDAGTTVDARTDDARVSDAAMADSGKDSGKDAGGRATPGRSSEGGGCDCRMGRAGRPSNARLLALVGALACAGVRRRRSKRATPR